MGNRQDRAMFANLTRAIRNALAPKPRRVLFMDDVTAGDVEILPASELDWCREQVSAIGAGRPISPPGFAEAIVRRPREGAAQIADLAIPLLGARRALASELAPFEAVVTGDPNHPTPTRGIGYGPSPLSGVVLYALDGSDTVSALEVTLRGNAAETIAVLSAINVLPTPQPLIAADWAGLGVVELDDPAAIRRFAHHG
jgi:hypothetical protein